MVPALAFGVLVVWERRWRELLRIELYAGLILQAMLIGVWIAAVYHGPDGLAHLKTFFWNNLVGRFAKIDSPPELQYATGHKNSPGKYLKELPLYLYPWTLLAIAALWRVWRERAFRSAAGPALRFATAVFLPAFVLLSLAATARNIYAAPALPGVALLIAWWAERSAQASARIDRVALRATALLLLLSATVLCAAALVMGADAWDSLTSKTLFVGVSAAGLIAACYFSVHAWAAARRPALAQRSLFLAWAALFIAPLSQLDQVADGWQDLPQIARTVAADSSGRRLLLIAPDETTRALIDMYTRPDVGLLAAPTTPAARAALRDALQPQGAVALTQLPGRTPPRDPRLAARMHAEPPRDPPWLADSGLAVLHRYRLPNGRRYALLGAPNP
jgi:4-amino-4-deoxy-L-arabinose transferase-like glycosyltransferase